MFGISARAIAALVFGCLAAPATAADGAAHLLSGAAHFRAGRFEEAVVEFKVARQLGAAKECHWYIAAGLTRAGRLLEALEAFEHAQELAPESADALFLYYRGVACSENQLVACAANSFELASKTSGPRVSRQARSLAAEASALLATEPPRSAIDALIARGTQHLNEGRPLLARVFGREAARLAAHRVDRFREAEASAVGRLVDGGSTRP